MRNIIWSEDFTAQVESAGGARLIDEALSPILDGLSHNPYGFHRFENDFTSFRFAKTEAIPGKIGSLTIIFTIDDQKQVVLEWFEEDVPF